MKQGRRKLHIDTAPLTRSAVMRHVFIERNRSTPTDNLASPLLLVMHRAEDEKPVLGIANTGMPLVPRKEELSLVEPSRCLDFE